MAKKEKQVEAPVQAEADQQAAPSLTLQDLVLVAQIIQLTSTRGTFRAEELESVGGLYNKLIAFLQSTVCIFAMYWGLDKHPHLAPYGGGGGVRTPAATKVAGYRNRISLLRKHEERVCLGYGIRE